MQQGLSIKARAVALLSRREHSRLELARKLAPHSENPESLERLLDDLTREGWLSDERFAQSVIHRRSRTHGTARIVNELRQSGVPDIAISEARETLRDTEFDRAKVVWEKKFGARLDAVQAPDDADSNTEIDPITRRDRARAAYAKQARFLAGRGFSHDVIARVLGADVTDGE